MPTKPKYEQEYEKGKAEERKQNYHKAHSIYKAANHWLSNLAIVRLYFEKKISPFPDRDCNEEERCEKAVELLISLCHDFLNKKSIQAQNKPKEIDDCIKILKSSVEQPDLQGQKFYALACLEKFKQQNESPSFVRFLFFAAENRYLDAIKLLKNILERDGPQLSPIIAAQLLAGTKKIINSARSNESNLISGVDICLSILNYVKKFKYRKKDLLIDTNNLFFNIKTHEEKIYIQEENTLINSYRTENFSAEIESDIEYLYTALAKYAKNISQLLEAVKWLQDSNKLTLEMCNDIKNKLSQLPLSEKEEDKDEIPLIQCCLAQFQVNSDPEGSIVLFEIALSKLSNNNQYYLHYYDNYHQLAIKIGHSISSNVIPHQTAAPTLLNDSLNQANAASHGELKAKASSPR